MTLIQRLKKEDEVAFNKWFDRWYKKTDLEKQISQTNQKGYKAVRINIYHSNDERKNEDDYTQQRLRNSNFISMLEDKLGEGFKINHKKDKHKLIPFFGIERHEFDEYILISWGDYFNVCPHGHVDWDDCPDCRHEYD